MLALATATAAFVQPSMLPVVTRARTVHQPQVAMLANGQKQALVTAVAAMALVFNPMSAEAGRSGGRVGGRAPAPRAPTVSRPAPAAMAPRTTNVYVAPSPMGMGMGYGGYGMGGGSGVGLYLGLSVAEAFLREQQRQAYLQQQLKTQQQLGADQAAIQQLQQELAMQNQ